MTIPINFVLIKPDEEMFEQVELGDTGVKIKVDRTFETGVMATTSGVVMAVPERLYFNYSDMNKSLRYDTVMELEVGDRVICHYNAIKHGISQGMVIDGGVLIKYDGLFCRLREGAQPHPLNGIVLAEPITEEINSSVIIPDTVDRKSKIKSVVHYAGTPLKGYFDFPEESDGEPVKKGDIIIHSKHDCIPIQYSIYQCFDKGVTLWRMHMRDIEAVENAPPTQVNKYNLVKTKNIEDEIKKSKEDLFNYGETKVHIGNGVFKTL